MSPDGRRTTSRRNAAPHGRLLSLEVLLLPRGYLSDWRAAVALGLLPTEWSQFLLDAGGVGGAVLRLVQGEGLLPGAAGVVVLAVGGLDLSEVGQDVGFS